MKWKWIFVGTLLSAVLMTVFVFAIALVEYATSISQGLSNVLVYVFCAVSVAVGAAFAVMKSGTKAFFHAMAVAAVFIAAVVVMSLIINGAIKFDAHCVSVVSGILLSGFLGALAGYR